VQLVRKCVCNLNEIHCSVKFEVKTWLVHYSCGNIITARSGVVDNF
jgi:hypothetical protein